MIQGFENYTASLTDYEANVLVPRLVKGLENRVGSQYAISNKRIFRSLSDKGYEKVTEARVRKCINYIRINGLVQHLLANSHGYYIATSVEEVQEYADSLKERAEAIWAVRGALIGQLSGKLFL